MATLLEPALEALPERTSSEPVGRGPTSDVAVDADQSGGLGGAVGVCDNPEDAFLLLAAQTFLARSENTAVNEHDRSDRRPFPIFRDAPAPFRER